MEADLLPERILAYQAYLVLRSIKLYCGAGLLFGNIVSLSSFAVSRLASRVGCLQTPLWLKFSEGYRGRGYGLCALSFSCQHHGGHHTVAVLDGHISNPYIVLHAPLLSRLSVLLS